jgi:hypothetical protein
MKSSYVLLGMLVGLGFLAPGLDAAVIISDNFDGYPAVPSGGLILYTSPISFGAWNVTAGSVDLLNNYPGLPCHSGTQCLDMDGSTNAAGTITTNFSYTAGVTYALSFWYAGNQRNANADTMNVTLGGQSTQLIVPYLTAWTQGTLVFTPATNGTGALTFAHLGSDNQGILLDDVTLQSRGGAAPIPEPATWAMMAGGLMLAGLLRRR